MATENRGMTAKWDFIAFKGYWGGIEGMIFMPIIAFITIARATHVETSAVTVVNI